MASSKPILRAEDDAMREAGANADALTREARMATNLNIFFFGMLFGLFVSKSIQVQLARVRNALRGK